MVSELATATIAVIFTMVGLVFLIQYIMTALGYMGCMKKAGEATWKAWIPLYNDYTMYKIVNLKGFLIVFKIIYVIITTIYLSLTFSYIGEGLDKVNEYVDNSLYTNNTTSEVRVKNKYSVNKTVTKSDEEIEEDIREMFGAKTLGITIFSMLNSLFGIALFVITILFAINISKAYGLGGGTIAGMILIPHIFILIIGFGSSKYQNGDQSADQGAITNL